MTPTRKLWTPRLSSFVLSFSVLLIVGRDISIKAPPMPERVVSQSGQTLHTKADSQRGRQVWQSMGGTRLGSINRGAAGQHRRRGGSVRLHLFGGRSHSPLGVFS